MPFRKKGEVSIIDYESPDFILTDAGTGLLEDLKPRRNNDVVIGLTSQIIYNPNELSDTYGTMGISKLGSNVCIISSKIPRNGRVQDGENFVKLALHELGHSYGLPHCPDQKCYMVDAEHKMKLPNTKYFCLPA